LEHVLFLKDSVGDSFVAGTGRHKIRMSRLTFAFVQASI
jgi:hypothetical protein